MPAIRHLWLIRHAESPAQSGSGADIDRHLSERGLADCERLALWLTNCAASDWLITSAADRTVQTSQALSQALGVPGPHQIVEPRLYNAAEGVVLDAVQSLPHDARRAAIIGHNPAVSMLASRLLGRSAALHMPPLGCVGLFGPGDWSDWRVGQCHASASWSPDRVPMLAGSNPESNASDVDTST